MSRSGTEEEKQKQINYKAKTHSQQFMAYVKCLALQYLFVILYRHSSSYLACVLFLPSLCVCFSNSVLLCVRSRFMFMGAVRGMIYRFVVGSRKILTLFLISKNREEFNMRSTFHGKHAHVLKMSCRSWKSLHNFCSILLKIKTNQKAE